MIGIYKITSPTGRIYIGQSVNIAARFKKYKWLGCKTQTRLYRSLLKYGYEAHKFEVIEECSIELLNERERYWQDQNFGICHKMSLNSMLTKSDTKSGLLSIEVRAKIGKKQTGVKLSKEHCDNISKGKKGKPKPPGFSEMRSKLMQGFKQTQERKNKISANSGKAKIVFDNSSFVFYNSVKEVADLYNIKDVTLSHKLIGRKKNNTNFIYA